ncbi:MAG: menaquinone reductase multiheme cytochrome c subunit QrcA [Thermodesulfobacteriota bacterium]|nr:menaquinone reductase multiheme cytochrome c subunit QrcA [Thermodesulfobacteriota bacterium]
MSAQDKSTHASVGGGNQESPKDKGGLAMLIAFIIGLVGSLVVGWVVFPELLYSEKEQPFEFSHALHMNELGDCEACHFFREDGTFAGVPTLNACLDCHSYAIGETEAELTFVEQYVDQNKEVPWLIYSRQPDCVFFSHAAHVRKAGMDCVTCHGYLGVSESMPVYQENRITGYSRDIWGYDITGVSLFKKNVWESMKMDDCARCHEEETGSKGACFQCHK